MSSYMKRLLVLIIAVAAIAAGNAKKVKLTIDGTVSPSQTKLYLIINEDTANAQLLPISDGKFSATVKVERDDFIRLHDSKLWPEYASFVLIPDSKHITVDCNTGAISGSPMSQKLQATCREIRDSSPEGFHIDVFSEDPEVRRDAQARATAIRNRMLEQQRAVALNVFSDDKTNIFSVWIAYCFPGLYFKSELEGFIESKKPSWANHPLLQKKR